MAKHRFKGSLMLTRKLHKKPRNVREQAILRRKPLTGLHSNKLLSNMLRTLRMQNLKLTGLLLICALAISSCASNGVAVPPAKPQPIPKELMKIPDFEKKARAELLETPPKPIAG